MMRSCVRGVVLLSLLLLTGCGESNRYVRWVKAQFPQVYMRCQECRDAGAYVRHADLYDGFNTIGHYDALWYATPVRAHHLQEMAQRYGWTADTLAEKREKEDAADRAEISFYVLMSADAVEGIRPHLSAKPADAVTGVWSAVIRTDGYEFPAKQVKKVLLPAELVYSFGDRFDFHYRFIYLVTFARNAEGVDILTSATNLTLVLRSMKYQVTFDWDASLVARALACNIDADCGEASCDELCGDGLPIPPHDPLLYHTSPMSADEVHL